MFEIILKEEIPAPSHLVWGSICNTRDYPDWNPFVVACESTFQVGTPIIMRVKLFPFLTIRQKETVRENREGEFLEYGVEIPFGILYSSRQHILSPIGPNITRYESVFRMRGILAPIVRVLMGAQLIKGFREMTRALVEHASRSNISQQIQKERQNVQ